MIIRRLAIAVACLMFTAAAIPHKDIVTDEGIEKLKKALPRCKITRFYAL